VVAVIVEVIPVWDEKTDRIEYFVVRVLGTKKGFRAVQVFVDEEKLDDPYQVELYDAAAVRAVGERGDGTFDEVDVITREYYSMLLRGER
jgi:uncharacterized protein YkuJ